MCQPHRVPVCCACRRVAESCRPMCGACIKGAAPPAHPPWRTPHVAALTRGTGMSAASDAQLAQLAAEHDRERSRSRMLEEKLRQVPPRAAIAAATATPSLTDSAPRHPLFTDRCRRRHAHCRVQARGLVAFLMCVAQQSGGRGRSACPNSAGFEHWPPAPLRAGRGSAGAPRAVTTAGSWRRQVPLTRRRCLLPCCWRKRSGGAVVLLLLLLLASGLWQTTVFSVHPRTGGWLAQSRCK